MDLAQNHEKMQRLLSPFLDDELTQGESRRVRVHVEDCRECAATLEEMRHLRSLTASVQFAEPPEDRMAQIERSLSVRMPRQAGWAMIVAGLLAWVAYAAVLAWRAWPPGLQELMAGAIIIGLILLFVSVVRQRMIELPEDRYRRVKK